MKTSHGPGAKKIGLPPGSLVHVGKPTGAPVKISVLDYNQSEFTEYAPGSVEDAVRCRGDDTVTWVNIEGLEDTGLIEKIGLHFNLHPLVLEDILNTRQRPKLEEFEDYLFIVLKNLIFGEGKLVLAVEQISILVLKGFVFTFRERSDDLFDSLRKRIQAGKGLLRKSGPDYLAYAIIDTVVDKYFVLQDLLDDAVEPIDEKLLKKPGREILRAIQDLKRQMIRVRRGVSPLRELLAALVRSDSRLIEKSTRVYLRDVYDHAVRIGEAMESYRDLVSGMLDIYLSSVSNKMNEVMKVLTVFAAVFIPLTFLAGVYGMNFEFMPELKLPWAYPAIWGVFILVGGGLVYYFKRRNWL